MTWAEFRQWAWRQHQLSLPYSWAHSSIRRVVWADPHRGYTLTGIGHPAHYGVYQQRRLSVWLRSRDLIEKRKIGAWLDAAESYRDGWLVNDGSGIRWVADPEPIAQDLVRAGFVAVKCGL